MLQSVPSLRSAKPRLLGVFSTITPITIQVPAPNTLYLAETEQQLMMGGDDPTIDALQIVNANGIVVIWVTGALYAAGSQAAGVAFKPFILIPNTLSGGLVNISPHAYGMEPTVEPNQ